MNPRRLEGEALPGDWRRAVWGWPPGSADRSRGALRSTYSKSDSDAELARARIAVAGVASRCSFAARWRMRRMCRQPSLG